MFRHPLTQETELRLLEPAHAAAVYALVDHNRAHLGRWLSWVARQQSIADTQAHIRQCLLRFANNGCPLCGIWHQGHLVGAIDLLGIGAHSRGAEIGYWLDAAAQGRGLVSVACRVLVNHTFAVLGAHRVEIRAEPANSRSRAVAERAGFREEGTLRQVVNMGDHFADRVVYALLRDEWQDSADYLTFSAPLSEDAELRLLQPHYAEEIYALVERNRWHLRIEDWVDATTNVEHVRGFITQSLQRQADGCEIQWGIWSGGHFAGMIGTWTVDSQAHRAEMGYWLGEEFQGKGLMTAAMCVMIKFMFNELDLNRAELRIRTDNPRSRAVAARLGFSLEGIQRQSASSEGKLVDMACYGLLREEWKARTT